MDVRLKAAHLYVCGEWKQLETTNPKNIYIKKTGRVYMASHFTVKHC